MASKDAIRTANDLADIYVVGSNNVGIYRKMNPDYIGYVVNLAPALDDLLITGKQVISQRKKQGLPTW